MAQSKVINMTPGSNSFEICFSQGDVGVTRTMDLIERGGGYFEIPAGSVVKLAGTKPSGLGFNEEVAYSGHTITVTAAEGMTDEAGYIECELKITKEGLKQGSQNGHLAIEKDPHPEGTTDGSAEQIVPALTLLLRQVEEDLDDAEADIETMTQLKTATETAAGNAAASATAAGQSATAAAASKTAAETAKGAAETAQTAAETAQAGAEAAQARATEIVAGCISIDAETSELIIYE